jgi:carnitine 3-dehydrogenase
MLSTKSPLHLSGGAGGIGGLFEKPLWKATENLWRDLGAVSVDAGLGRRVVDGVAEELAARDQDEMVRQRDELLVNLLQLKARAKDLP